MTLSSFYSVSRVKSYHEALYASTDSRSKNQYVQYSSRRDQRQQAVTFQQSGKTVAHAVRFIKLYQETCGRLKAEIDNNDDFQLAKMLNSAQNRAGGKKALSDEEVKFIKDRLKNAAFCGSSINIERKINSKRNCAQRSVLMNRKKMQQCELENMSAKKRGKFPYINLRASAAKARTPYQCWS